MKIAFAFGAMLCFASIGMTQTIQGRDGIILPAPPAVEANPVTDDYFGTKIIDNYRWLEDAKSSQTRAFIEAENAYTARYLDKARIRPQVLEELRALENVTATTTPIVRAGSLFFARRIDGENHFSIYVRHGWTGKDERLIDSATLGRGPSTSISIADITPDGKLIAYEVGQGADEHSIRLFDVKAKKDLQDELPAARYDGTAFAPDGHSFYYAVNNKDGSLLLQHVLGTHPSQDAIILGHDFHGEHFGPNDVFSPYATDDSRYLVVEIDHGSPATRVDIVFRDLTKPNAPFEALVWAVDSRFSADFVENRWLVKTDYKAPNGRIMDAKPGILPDAWKTIVPEASAVIDDWSIVGNKIYVKRLKDVKTETSVYTLDGNPDGHIDFDTMGSASIVSGRAFDHYGFFSFESFIRPWTIYRLDTKTGKREIFFQPKIPFDASQYELKQVFFKSKDGTQIPIFIAGKKGLKQDGTERLLMIGYGGFQVSMTPTWNHSYAWWLQQGGWLAVPNLRGGGEYGELWHQQGMFEHKQNVFDDWFAAAEYLIDQRYTSPEHFAIHGRSNGGLLMGAAITQRPDLFSAVWCGYPLLDMLRYQKFMLGRYWTTEFGSSDNEKQFRYLVKYSPYQNVRRGTAYPAVIFFSNDHDTSHDALHARKMAALLQATSSSGRPILLHYNVSDSHSAAGLDQWIRDDADELAFLWTESGPTNSSASSHTP